MTPIAPESGERAQWSAQTLITPESGEVLDSTILPGKAEPGLECLKTQSGLLSKNRPRPLFEEGRRDLGVSWRAGDPAMVAALLWAMSADVRAAIRHTAEGEDGPALWLLFLADSHRAAMLTDLRSPELDESHFEDFTSELSALLVGALHVSDATDAAGEHVRAALARIPQLRQALSRARACEQKQEH